MNCATPAVIMLPAAYGHKNRAIWKEIGLPMVLLNLPADLQIYRESVTELQPDDIALPGAVSLVEILIIVLIAISKG